MPPHWTSFDPVVDVKRRQTNGLGSAFSILDNDTSGPSYSYIQDWLGMTWRHRPRHVAAPWLGSLASQAAYIATHSLHYL